MAYDSTIPATGHSGSQDYTGMQGNFAQIQNSFSVNHKPLASGAGTEGFHTQIQLAAPISDPNQAAPITSIYSKTISGTPQLFFQNGNMPANASQITSSLVKTSGEGMLPGGLQIRSGTSLWPGQNMFVNFSSVFPTACVSVVVSNANSGNNIATINVLVIEANRFQVFSPNNPAGANLSYIAIGY